METTAGAATSPGAHGSRGYHRLRVRDVVRETADASSFVFDVPAELEATFAYAAGQFCTFRLSIGGERQLRSYSMSSAPTLDEHLQVTVKRAPGGVVSNWMNDELVAGAEVEVSAPGGVFTLGEGDGDVVVFGAGSGITPIFSILKAGLATSSRRFRLLYANRDRDGVIFGPAIEALERAHPDRLRVVHNLDLDHGFVTPDTVRPLVHEATDPEFFVCGPGPFMDIVERTLLDEGVEPGRIHVERFTPLDPPVPPPASDAGTSTSVVTIELDGRTETPDHRPGTTILQTARQLGLSPPFSCEAGNCATCIAKLVEGSVEMYVNDVLDDDEVADGWVLTCQSVPTAPSVRVVYGYEED